MQLRFLVLDDHEFFLSGLQDFLETAFDGAEVTKIGNARHALERLDRGERFDVILTDINLPDIDGLMFLQAVRGRRLRAPVIAVSGQTSAEIRQNAKAAGAYGYFAKEEEPGVLLELVNAALNCDPAHWDDDTEKTRGYRPDSGETVFVTARQAAVLGLVAEGLSNKQIAQTLAISEPTVKTHLAAVFKALGARNRTSCVAAARSLGLV